MLRTLVFLAVLLASFVLPARAQPPDAGRFFDDAAQELAEVRKEIGGDLDQAKLDELAEQVTPIATAADATAADRAPQLDALDARIAELGPAPEKGAPAEAADIAAQRSALNKQRAALDAEIKRAKLLAVESRQLLADIADARRTSFQARLSQRTASPLTPLFWRNLGGSLGEDRARLDTLRGGVYSALRDAFAPDNRAYAIGGLAVGVFLILIGRWRVEHQLMRLTADRVPQGRLRRSALAFAIVVAATLFTGFGVQAIVSGLDWHDAFSESEKQLARSVVYAAFFGSFVAGLGRALLSSARPSWRLPAIADDVALALRSFPALLGGAVALSITLRRINSVTGASLSATVATTLLGTVLYAGLVLAALIRIRKARQLACAAEASATAAASVRSLWAGFILAAFWIAALGALVAALAGFVAFAQFVAALIVRTLMVGGAFFLLVRLIEDLCFTLVAARATWVHDRLGVQARTLDQLAVVLSGAFRIVAFLFALSLAFAGFGSGRAELSALGAQIGSRTFRIGQIEITPDAVLGAVAVCLLGLVAIRAFKRWLHDRYLPTTALDPAMRSSVTTMLGYAGGIVVLAFALSELGLSVERIAWVASALSVGIGFGLQAVVQNFVSGLILLVERPVKVGDWVAIGDIEGDIRRINVRATEIQMGDRSTMIVPNSELITKTVRNVTLANAQGRVRVRLPMPLDTEADAVITLMRASLAAHPSILDNPAVSVTADGVEGGSLIFVGVAFIDNPRQAGAIRSDILLDILARLRAANLALVAPQEISYRPVDAARAMPGAQPG